MWIDDLHTLLPALAPARVAFWPALGGASVTLAAAVRDGRRRTVLNERLHELRRPLQALALMTPGASGADAGDGALEMAAAALARLDREINGEREEGARATVAVRPLLEAARRRWAGQAALHGATIELRWRAGEAAVDGDRVDLVAALDNLVANALEHGGPRIELIADLVGERICLAVVDSGSGAGRRTREREAAVRGREARRRRDLRIPFGRLSGKARHGHGLRLVRLSGKARHGHGLRLVRRTAERHDGTFALHLGARGASAVLELPLSPLPDPLQRREQSRPARPGPAGSQSPGSTRTTQDDRDGPERTSTPFVSEGPSRSSEGPQSPSPPGDRP
ncbi:MAG TPA: ATP-binding protein [Solirubrobacterales bacterium]|nr:ATP-binding protein [Solirubrobacterales bacterium]